MIEQKQGCFTISEIMESVGSLKLNERIEHTIAKVDDKSIYIDSDFSLMIPKESISAEALYIILCFTEIIKNDVMINVKITKESILKSYKRKMNTDMFISTLKKYSKNEMPQNMSFLLKDWIDQTLVLTISNVVLMKTNHPAFLEELSYSSIKEAVIEKLSDNYVIIDREYFDRLVKFASKQNAIISFINAE